MKRTGFTLRLAAALLIAGAVRSSVVLAQEQERETPSTTTSNPYEIPPREGGLVRSIGQPPVWKWYTGPAAGAYLLGDSASVVWRAELGVLKDLATPIAGVLGLRGEGYVGARDISIDGGLRFTVGTPSLGLAVGADYNFRDTRIDLLLQFRLPVQRAGVFGAGELLKINLLPTRGWSVNLAIEIPVGESYRGKTRPRRDYARLPAKPSGELPPPSASTADSASNAALSEALANVRESAYWINRLTAPFIDQGASNLDDALAKMTPSLEELRDHLSTTEPRFPAGRTSSAELLFYHGELDRAFSIAVSGQPIPAGQSTVGGRLAAQTARDVLLEEVLYPYNRLLGMKKKKDTVLGLAAPAEAEFVGRLDGYVPAERRGTALHVFSTLIGSVEEARKLNREAWGERLVWLPLQFALTPEQHDTSSELDAIVERMTGATFTAGNHVSYLWNASFQTKLTRTIEDAEDYHVLWIHDVRGVNAEGEPDLVAFHQVARGYLPTLIRRVRAYDATGSLPVYMILLDQHYYEINKGRRWMELLENPLTHRVRLPDGFEYMEREIAEAQAELRDAVAGSRLLQERAGRYGDEWLRNQIKVHVNITYPADMTFWSRQWAALLSVPDNVMRDHRKIVFYDVTEEDPYRGEVMLTGMGVGEHYVGPSWEDRSIVVQGPAALPMKNAARQVLLDQGFREDQIPYPLRPKRKPADYDRRVLERIQSELASGGMPARAMQLHNETGYLFKPINVAKAVLYSLMPPGSVLLIPDSLWNSHFLAALLLGQCLRGGKVFLINPSLATAPSSGFPQLSRAHELFSRLILIQDLLGEQISAAGGMLRTGLYDLDVDVGNIPERVRLTAKGIESTPFLQSLFGFDPRFLELLDRTDSILEGFEFDYEIPLTDDEKHRPKLHLKTNLMATAEAWRLVSQPGLADVYEAYLEALAAQVQAPTTYADLMAIQEAVESVAWAPVFEFAEALSAEELARAALYLIAGSSNQDYRSMLMDGEIALVVSGAAGLNALFDYVFLMGTATWLEDRETLDALLPPYGGFRYRIGRMIKEAL